MPNHFTILTDNKSNKNELIKSFSKENKLTVFGYLKSEATAIFSNTTLKKLISEEEVHDRKIITADNSQSLKSMSSGEQKQLLLQYLLDQKPDFIVLDNPFDNLDTEFQEKLKKILIDVSEHTSLIHIISRIEDILPIKSDYYKLEKEELIAIPNIEDYKKLIKSNSKTYKIPINENAENHKGTELIRFKNVSVSFDGKCVLNNINWTINKGDFWQLIGKNGSGKTTLLSMLIGENSKGYGQELYLFGKKKGSGESIWDIKKKIGYFTPAMNHNFSGNHTIENMVLSGLNDSIGLYVKPTEIQLRTAKKWLHIAELDSIKKERFCDATIGQQRLAMLVRAMVKQPLLLILDEPTNGLDNKNTLLFINLINQISMTGETAIVFVSHREEKGLKPKHIFRLKMTSTGSIGIIS